MIVKETNPNSTWSHKYLDLSDSEKVRVKEIFEELRSIFNADSIDFIPGNAILGLGCLGRKCDYELKIYNGDTIGYHVV